MLTTDGTAVVTAPCRLANLQLVLCKADILLELSYDYVSACRN